MECRHLVVLSLLVSALLPAARTAHDDRALLDSALQRAPAECHAALVDGWERQVEGKIPLSFQTHATARERCNPKVLAVTPGHGSNGLIRREPSEGRVLTNYSTEVKQSSGSRAAGAHGNAEGGEPLAFVIIASGEQTVDNLLSLLRALDGPTHSYAIHLDSSAPADMHDALPGLAASLSAPEALIILPSIDVSWGGPSMLRVELEAMRALASSGRYWRHLLVLSGSDYPLRSVAEMSDRFGALGPFSHFEIFYQHEHFLKNRAFDTAFVECKGWTYRVRDKRPRPRGLLLWGGSSWVSLSRDFSLFVTSCLFEESKRDPANFFRTLDAPAVGPQCRTATDLLAYMEHTQSAEELYLHTLFMSTPHCLQLNTNYWRWVHWGQRKGRHCNKSDMCGTSPQYLTDRELRTAFHFTPALFARKFASNHSLLRERADALTARHSQAARLEIRRANSTLGGSVPRAPRQSAQAHAQALDGNEFTAWQIPAPSFAGTTLSVGLGQRARVCSMSVSVEAASLPPAASFSLHHRAKKASDWNTTFPTTSFSEAKAASPDGSASTRGHEAGFVAEGEFVTEATADGWVLYRLFIGNRAPAKRSRGVSGKYFELRLWAGGAPGQASSSGPTGSGGRRGAVKIFEFQLHGCGGGRQGEPHRDVAVSGDAKAEL